MLFCCRGSMFAKISACGSLRGGAAAAKPIELDNANGIRNQQRLDL